MARPRKKKEQPVPKLDPDDVEQPSAADVAAAQSDNTVNAATTTAAPPAATASKAAPNLFGGSTTTPTPAPAFGTTPSNGFNNGNVPLGNSMSTGGFGGGYSGGYGNSSGFGGMGGVMPQQQIAADANTTAAFGSVMAAESSAPPEHWMKSFWRPAMGWLYMAICFADFIVFPAISMFLPIIEKGFGLQMGYTAWQSLTLSNGGLIHLAFGAILGVSAYGRTQEKKTGTS